jgi:TetR/AcrR family transcriptional regulator, cholesterol catabolism regulator
VTRKKQIEVKATELFRVKGYSATSMRDLAGMLGIEAASLYSHIKSKEEILQNICFRIATEFFEALDKVETESKTSKEKLTNAIKAHIKVITADPAASAVFFNEWKHMKGNNLTEFLELRDRYENRFRKILEEGMKNEEFRTIDSKFAVLTIFSSTNWLHHWYKPEGKMTPEQIGDHLANLIINGLGREDSLI